MTWEYTRAENGNIALTARIDLLDPGGNCVLAIGFGKDADTAARNAIGSLRDGFEKAKSDYIAGWQEWVRDHNANGAHDRDLPRSAWRFFVPMNPRNQGAPLLPACRSPGDLVKGIKTSVVITWYGPGIWWRRLAGYWLRARMTMCGGCCLIYNLPNSRMGTGCRICGWMALPIGMVYKWTRRLCRFSWRTWLTGIRLWTRPPWRNSGRW